MCDGRGWAESRVTDTRTLSARDGPTERQLKRSWSDRRVTGQSLMGQVSALIPLCTTSVEKFIKEGFVFEFMYLYFFVHLTSAAIAYSMNLSFLFSFFFN